MVLIILGVILVLKIIGQFMTAKRRMNEQDQYKRQKSAEEKEKAKFLKNKGKIQIHRNKKDDYRDDDFTDYEEIKE